MSILETQNIPPNRTLIIKKKKKSQSLSSDYQTSLIAIKTIFDINFKIFCNI